MACCGRINSDGCNHQPKHQMKKTFNTLLRRILAPVVVLAVSLMTVRGVPVFQQVGSVLVMSNADVTLKYNLTAGTTDFYWQNVKKISAFYAGVGLSSGYITGNSTSYSNRSYTVLSSNQVVVTSTGGGLPTMEQYFTLDQNDSFLTSVAMAGSGLSANWMGPLVMSTTGGVDIGITNDNRALFVPFDNDDWVPYNAMPINSSSTSYEVAAFYDNTSRNGLVVGSVTHNIWKTGVYFQGANNKLNALNVFGGQPDPWDVTGHGSVTGNTISSPTIFVGFGTDWRTVMETYANENAAQVPMLAWSGGVPFGWNSWYAYGSDVNYSNATAVSSFIKNNLQTNNFNDNGTVYINLDSYWSNLTNSQLQEFASYCHANGQKAGIYWAPFVYWGTAAQGSNSIINGSTNYTYSDAYLRTASGAVQTVDGGIALDPTHPGSKEQIANYIWYFEALGYDYVKLDFLSHGALEGVHYDTNVTTGIGAYNEGMEYIQQQNALYQQTNGPMFVSEAISPIFPYQYGQARRIACDAPETIGDTAYTLNAVSYGWWINSRLYQHSDPDVMKFAGATTNENQSRLIGCAIAGTVFLNSDDLASATGQTLAMTCLTNAGINAVARLGQSFRPIEGNTGTNACNQFVEQNGSTYIAVFNYTASATNETVTLSRAGISAGNYFASDLWSGALTNVSSSLSVSLNAKQSKLFKLVPATSAISINFQGSGTAMGATESAGAVPTINWNNATGASGSNLALTNYSGVVSGATITWSAGGIYSIPDVTNTPGSYRMMKNYLDNTATTTVSVAGLPAETNGWTVLVYFDGYNGETREGAYTIGGTGVATNTIIGFDNANVDFSGTFTQANNSAGNYVVFTLGNVSGFTLTSTPVANGATYPRAPVNGLQIIPQ